MCNFVKTKHDFCVNLLWLIRVTLTIFDKSQILDIFLLKLWSWQSFKYIMISSAYLSRTQEQSHIMIKVVSRIFFIEKIISWIKKKTSYYLDVYFILNILGTTNWRSWMAKRIQVLSGYLRKNEIFQDKRVYPLLLSFLSKK